MYAVRIVDDERFPGEDVFVARLSYVVITLTTYRKEAMRFDTFDSAVDAASAIRCLFESQSISASVWAEDM